MTYCCQCPCGTNQFEIHGEPITRFYCHCTICQDKYKAPFADVTLFKLDDVEVPASDGLTFGKYKRFGAVDRGICDSCQKPVMATLGEGEKGLAFVAAQNYQNPEALPPAEMHVFYGTRVEDFADDLPKYKNYLTSQFAVLKLLRKAWKSDSPDRD